MDQSLEDLRSEMLEGINKILGLGRRFLPDKRIAQASKSFWLYANQETLIKLSQYYNQIPVTTEQPLIPYDPVAIARIKEHLQEAQKPTWVTPVWKTWYNTDVSLLLTYLDQ